MQKNKIKSLFLDNWCILVVLIISLILHILALKELGFNMVRLGIGLYGHYPSDEVSKEVELKPAMKLKTIITNIIR